MPGARSMMKARASASQLLFPISYLLIPKKDPGQFAGVFCVGCRGKALAAGVPAKPQRKRICRPARSLLCLCAPSTCLCPPIAPPLCHAIAPLYSPHERKAPHLPPGSPRFPRMPLMIQRKNRGGFLENIYIEKKPWVSRGPFLCRGLKKSWRALC